MSATAFAAALELLSRIRTDRGVFGTPSVPVTPKWSYVDAMRPYFSTIAYYE
jgi:hypothetical protein